MTVTPIERDREPLILPPHDLEAEMAVLGAMMLGGEGVMALDAESMARCLDILSTDSFFRPGHQMVFEAIVGLVADGKPVDAVTVAGELSRRGTFTAVGAGGTLHTLIASVPVAANALHYANRLKECQSQREHAQLGGRVLQLAADASLTPAERADAVSELVAGMTADVQRDGAVSAADLIVGLMADLEAGPSAVPGIPSGWKDFDAIVPGFRPGEITVIGGRPGAGKSVALLRIAAHAAMNLGLHVLAVTLEMSRDEYMERLLAAESGVPLTSIRERNLSDGDWRRIGAAAERIAAAKTLHIHEGPVMSPLAIDAELRAMARRGTPAALMTLDYLQLMEAAGQRESRQVEVSGYSRALKLIARKHKIPAIIGSQLNRGPDLRAEHRPVMADLRESGAVENDADIVVLLYRDDSYHQDSPNAGEVELIVAKNRQGRSNVTATLAFRGDVASIDDLYRDPAQWSPSTSLGG
jgi:replicative DNA helicase